MYSKVTVRPGNRVQFIEFLSSLRRYKIHGEQNREDNANGKNPLLVNFKKSKSIFPDSFLGYVDKLNEHLKQLLE